MSVEKTDDKDVKTTASKKRVSSKKSKEVTSAVEPKKKAKTVKKVIEEAKEVTSAVEPKKEDKPDVLNKLDYNPMDEILQKKAQNEEKKVAKITKKEAKEKAKTASKAIKKIVEERGNKAESISNKRNETKENVMKAEAKKFIELKETSNFEEAENSTVLSSFVDAYKKMFTFNARSSRFEFWSFVLVNFIFLSVLTFGIVELSEYIGYLATKIIFIVLGVIEFFVYSALLARRIHDTGNTVWKGFLRPIFICLAIMVGIFIFNESATSENSFLTIFSLCNIMCYIYFLVKTVIVTAFIEGEDKENSFGFPKPINEAQKSKLVFLISLYFTIITVYYFFIKVSLHYLY